MDKIRCPHCGVYVEPREGGAPFFCTACHQVVDPQVRRAGVAAHPDSPSRAPPEPVSLAPSSLAVKHGMAAGQMPAFGYLLALVVAAGAGYGLGWLSNNYLYLPLVGAGVAGWLISRALALGSGGGTPDRGPLGYLLLAVACVGALGIWTWVDYRSERQRDADHWSRVFGPEGTQSAVLYAKRLSERDTEKDGVVTTVENGRTVNVAEEETRAQLAVAAGVPSNDPFDVHLLASVRKKGFEGFVRHRFREGREVRIRPEREGWVLGGPATIALAVVELLTMVGFAFHKRD